MTFPNTDVASLRAALRQPRSTTVAFVDYRIAAALGRTFLASSRTNAPALLVPLDHVPEAAGRRGGGFLLAAIPQVAFECDGRTWQQGAAVLECTDEHLSDTFLVLVADIAHRLEAASEVSWQTVITTVDEWQALLTRRAVMTVEQQLGLWGELWIIANAVRPDLLVQSWLGPDRHPLDFFLGGVGLELKVTRQRHVHHVSYSQVDRPTGDYDGYLLSLWVGAESDGGLAVHDLVDLILFRVQDQAAFLKRVTAAGYVPAHRDQYEKGFRLLEAPVFFKLDQVPRVRDVDTGISHIRYVVTLDPELAVGDSDARVLWTHFCGAQPSTTTPSQFAK